MLYLRAMKLLFRFLASDRRLLWLVVLLSFFIAVLVCVIISRVLPFPIIVSDTNSYVEAFRGDNVARILRTTGYGFVVHIGYFLHWPAFAMYLQLAVWCVLVAFIAFVGAMLLESPLAGGLIAVLFVLSQIRTMDVLPSHWHIASDVLYADILTGACLCVAMAALRRSWRYAWVAVFLMSY